MPKHIEYLAEQIKIYRKKLGLSQEQLAENTGISFTLIKDIERAKANPTLGTMIKIAEALQVSVAELLDVDNDLEDSEQILEDISEELHQFSSKKLRTIRLFIRLAQSSLK